MPQDEIAIFQQQVLNWYQASGRKDLPWQEKNNPYKTWLSEIMLQQTQVTTVIPYFLRFIEHFTDVAKLAAAPIDLVLHLWTGLGYYARARNLHRTAIIIHEQYGDVFPADIDALQELPGIGRSTAGAIMSLAYGESHPILDGNVKRVLTRFYGIETWPGEKRTHDYLWQIAESHTPEKSVAEYTQAMMDLGAMVCTRSKPKCDLCPLQKTCIAYHDNKTNIIPKSKPRKVRPTRESNLLILSNDEGQIFLQQRPPSGIWGGLWCFPQCDMDEDAIVWCRDNLNFHIQIDEVVERFKHSFSHFHLQIQPILASITGIGNRLLEAEPSIWYNPEQPQDLGLASPVKKLIEKYGERSAA